MSAFTLHPAGSAVRFPMPPRFCSTRLTFGERNMHQSSMGTSGAPCPPAALNLPDESRSPPDTAAAPQSRPPRPSARSTAQRLRECVQRASRGAPSAHGIPPVPLSLRTSLRPPPRSRRRSSPAANSTGSSPRQATSRLPSHAKPPPAQPSDTETQHARSA